MQFVPGAKLDPELALRALEATGVHLPGSLSSSFKIVVRPLGSP